MIGDSLRILGSATRARLRRSRFHGAALFLFILVAALYTFGQEATIVGTVTDPSGAAVAGAAITLTEHETGQVHHLTTGGQGEYVAPDIHIGHYTVRVEAKGFKSSERKDLVLQVGDRTRVDFQMQVGTAQETVTVEGTAVAVQSDTSEVSEVVTGDQLAHLGTNGRSLYTFINLTPGSSSLQGDSQTPTSVGGDGNVSFNGNRPVHNLYMIDGGEDADRGGGGTIAVMPSIEGLGEFRTLTSNYDAEYGLSSAATMTSVIKSGSKAFHASAWEFFRNDDLDSRNYFNPSPEPVAELRYNIFGFNAGGPIDFWKKEHKSFFFYNMEWRRTVQGGVYNQEVPFPATYGGDFSANLPKDVLDVNKAPIPNSGLYVPCATVLSAAQVTAFNNAGITTFSTPNANGCTPQSNLTAAQNPTFVPFPGNMIPSALIAGNATALLNEGIFPAPTNGQQFQGGNKQPITAREEMVRIDHSFNDKFSIFGHYVRDSVSQTYGETMWSGDNVPTIGNTFGNPSYSGVVHLLHTIRPNLLNEIAFNYNGNKINILPAGIYAQPSSGFGFPRIFPGPNADTRNPTINLSAQTGSQYSPNWVPWINKYNDYQIRDDVSWTRGAHQIRMGGSWAIYKKQQDVFASTEGNFGFNGSYSGNDFADFLLGYAQQYQEDAIHDHGNWNNVSWAAYIQDNWRVNKKLTLNLGLRWDGAPHTYEINKRMSSFYANLYNPANAATFDNNGTICSGASDPAGGCTAVSPGLGTSPNSILAGVPLYVNGIGIGGVGGVPRGMVDNHWADFGPRVGFAYDPTGLGKTVIRGGFGLMYERIQGNDVYDSATDVPFDASVTFNNVLLSNPGTSIANGTTLSVPIVASSMTGFDRVNYKPPTSAQFSIGVEQQLGSKAVLSVAYVGTQNRHQNDYHEINAPDESKLPCLLNPKSLGCPSGALPYNQVVQYPGYHSIRLATDEANAHYNSLQTSVRGRVARDLELQAGWTLSKAVDPTTGGGNGFDLDNVSNPYVGWKFDNGASIFDRRNVVFISYVYDIPLLRNATNGAAKALLGGWQLSSIISMMTGAPVDITQGGSTAASIVPNSNVRPDLTGKITYPKKTVTLANGTQAFEWFDPSVFTPPACTVGGSGADCFGNLAHDAVRGPGRDNWNMSLFKNFNFTERARLEFRVDAFNIWNHTQFIGNVQQGGISNNQTAGNFGTVTSAADPRILQLGLKLVF